VRCSRGFHARRTVRFPGSRFPAWNPRRNWCSSCVLLLDCRQHGAGGVSNLHARNALALICHVVGILAPVRSRGTLILCNGVPMVGGAVTHVRYSPRAGHGRFSGCPEASFVNGSLVVTGAELMRHVTVVTGEELPCGLSPALA